MCSRHNAGDGDIRVQTTADMTVAALSQGPASISLASTWGFLAIDVAIGTVGSAGLALSAGADVILNQAISSQQGDIQISAGNSIDMNAESPAQPVASE